ncbi:3-keto-disaccharide hydrolase [Roseibacillus ishigakijimensis]|uniref:DUF1080 domain-containing protein n=1 Tax=Roseibacillus ishigakijimensis TaxID=454146 RepID=A0A934RMP4_9BACT|nr:DUF1080 domain-containing protein [Roseibacillus ishigakijimensis]MBK1833620.1 DUF1080 domain-containing protein [Roseibacillus ishigakijimensis]
MSDAFFQNLVLVLLRKARKLGLMMKMGLILLFVGWTAWLSAEEEAVAWTSLFDGETLAGWTKADGKEVAEGRWLAEKGVLTRQSLLAGDLYSAKEYGDFEFAFEWRISEGGNSGVKYRVARFGKALLGLEYQLLDDDKHPDGKNGGNRQTAALYDLKPARADKPLKPVGEWNQSRIMVKEGVVRHFLNGEEVMTLEIPSAEWKERFQKSKYAKNAGFGVNAKGRLMLQDHGDRVSFRKLQIREF